MSEDQQPIPLEQVDPHRRAFLQGALKILGGILVLELGGAGVLFLRSRSLDGTFGGLINAGPITNFTPGSVTEFEDGNFFLICTTDGGFMAIYRRCPHLGCTVEWIGEKDKFYCPCHSASFDHNGEYQTSIVSRSLDTFPILFEDGMVKVNTAMPQNREHHTPEHISYPV